MVGRRERLRRGEIRRRFDVESRSDFVAKIDVYIDFF